MMSLEVIAAVNNEIAQEAAREGLYPYALAGIDELARCTPFSFPNIGYLEPQGWEKTGQTWFVDKTGYGLPTEPALTWAQFRRRSRDTSSATRRTHSPSLRKASSRWSCRRSGRPVRTYRQRADEETWRTVMAKLKMTYGTTTPGLNYREVTIDQIVGKTVQGVARTTVQGENGSEPCVVLLFTDGTRHGFVLPGDGPSEGGSA